MSFTPVPTFGLLLKQLRKRAGMTQRDLAAALGYSDSLISSLEKGQRLPDIQIVAERFIPVLGLQDDSTMASILVECAAAARGERLPAKHQAARARPHTARRHGIPALPTPLIGRDEIVNQLGNRLLGHRGRLLTLVGPPGVGKTTLALTVATQVQPHYRDGAYFVSLATVSDPMLMATTVVATLSPGDVSTKPPQTRLIELLRHQTILLLLDNLEQIEGAAPLIATLLTECPALTILATSRERLHLRAEQRFKVPSLDLAPAIELFIKRAQAVDADFDLTAQNQPTLASICQRLDCLPLAIELCAVQIDLHPPAQLLAQLQNRRLDLLMNGAYDLPVQQRTLRAAIERSYALLNIDERTLFRSLSVFAGGFALEAIETVSGWEAETATSPLPATLHALIGKSLVRTETLPSGEPRFLLLETIREFSLEQARLQGEDTELRRRHYEAYLQLFRTGDYHLRKTEAATWLVRLPHEHDNLRAALKWAFDEARYADAAWLLMAVQWLWHTLGHWYELGYWLMQLLPHRHQLDVDLRLATLLNLWAVSRALEEFQPFDPWADEVMALVELCPHKLLQAGAWHFAANDLDDFSQAASAWERSISLARTADIFPELGAGFCLWTDRNSAIAAGLWAYGKRLLEQGHFAQATILTLESLAICQARASRFEIIYSLGNLGRLALLQGDLAQAHTNLDNAVNIATTFNHQEMLGLLQPFLGIVTFYRGDASEARRLLHESLQRCLDLQDSGFLGRVYGYLTEVALWDGEVEQAVQWLAQSLAAYSVRPHRCTVYVVERLFVAARVAAAQQQHLQAAMRFGVADQISRRLDYVYAGPMRSQIDAALVTAQDALEPVLFAEAFAIGQQMPLTEAFATILASDHR